MCSIHQCFLLNMCECSVLLFFARIALPRLDFPNLRTSWPGYRCINGTLQKRDSFHELRVAASPYQIGCQFSIYPTYPFYVYTYIYIFPYIPYIYTHIYHVYILHIYIYLPIMVKSLALFDLAPLLSTWLFSNILKGHHNRDIYSRSCFSFLSPSVHGSIILVPNYWAGTTV